MKTIKNILSIIIIITLLSCNDDDYYVYSTEILKGVVSAKEEGYSGRVSRLPKIYIQTPTATKVIDIPYQNENDYKIGDSITLAIQKLKIK